MNISKSWKIVQNATKNNDTPHGLDDGPGTEEWNAINREMLGKLRELRRKYAPPSITEIERSIK